MNTFPIIPCICVFFIITFSIEIAWAVQINRDYIVLTPKRLFASIKTLNKFGAMTSSTSETGSFHFVLH